jgi:DNA-directed RNA polymerase sigma subunit (sigma70/sigma32)
MPNFDGDYTSCALDVADEGEKSLSELGEMLGITKEGARQIEVKAINRILTAVDGDKCR